MGRTDRAEVIAARNWNALKSSEFLGHGVVIGKNRESDMFLIYWITDKSPVGRWSTRSIDYRDVVVQRENPEKPNEPVRFMYKAITEFSLNGHMRSGHVIGNGDQTKLFERGGYDEPILIDGVLKGTSYLPDQSGTPTPRITGLLITEGLDAQPTIQFSVRQKSLFGVGCVRMSFQCNHIDPGYGLCITTRGELGSLDTFLKCEPVLIPIDKLETRDIVADFWDILDPKYRIGIAAKRIGPTGATAIQTINRPR